MAEMKVEIYDMLESTELAVMDIDDDSKTLIEELGLVGQKTLLSPQTGNIRPYNLLTKDQQFICMQLFPICSELKNYSDGPIPYRVLKEAAAAKEHFKYLYVLHEAPMQVKDPVLVGANDSMWGKPSAYDMQKLSLVARWGTALESWETLHEMAVAKFIKKAQNDFAALENTVKSALAMLKQGIVPTNTDYNIDTITGAMPFKS